VVTEVGDDIVAELLSLLNVLGEISGSGDRPLLWFIILSLLSFPLLEGPGFSLSRGLY
jgi:hypothetical protein